MCCGGVPVEVVQGGWSRAGVVLALSCYVVELPVFTGIVVEVKVLRLCLKGVSVTICQCCSDGNLMVVFYSAGVVQLLLSSRGSVDDIVVQIRR